MATPKPTPLIENDLVCWSLLPLSILRIDSFDRDHLGRDVAWCLEAEKEFGLTFVAPVSELQRVATV